jgi:hypothetical protein
MHLECQVREFPITDNDGNRLGHVSLNDDTIDALTYGFPSFSLAPTILRGLTAARRVDDQIVGFAVRFDPAQESIAAEMSATMKAVGIVSSERSVCGPCDCEDCTREDNVPLGPVAPPGHGVLWGDSDD